VFDESIGEPVVSRLSTNGVVAYWWL
jgi:hypothetical protein